MFIPIGFFFFFLSQEINRSLRNSLSLDFSCLVRTLHNIGGIYRRKKEYDNALTCFREVRYGINVLYVSVFF